MTDDHPATSAQPYSGRAIGALVVGLASIVLVSVSIWLGLVVAAAAVVLALASRRELKARPDLRGFRLSLAAFLAGAGVLLFNGLPLLISITLVTVATGLHESF
ncbi:hypothetical protein [Salinibacterium sp. ZJ450]|uniref:hypothetical protein n=1 Tax=Salinibacterium sp. ZJ450 TaxID=2708338 RepID=UPI00141D7BBD|nr:hypothetical protein [Salinibacterium sp. ZJ450]